MNHRQSAAAAFLAIVTGVAAWLRLSHLGLPSFWLDEILGYDIATEAARAPIWRWLVPFESEHGPLFHATELAGRFLSQPEAAARLAPAVFGVATVVIAWLAAKALEPDSGVAWAFVILVAASPLHVYYSREGRPYSLLILLATATLLLLLRGSRRVIIAFALCVYTSAIALPYLVSVSAAAIRRRAIALAAALAAAVTYIIYGASRVSAIAPAGFAAPRWHLATEILESFAASAIDTSHIHRSAYTFLLFAILGAIDLARRNRAAAWTVVSLAVFPVAITLVALALGQHWFAVRYVTPALPAYLLLVACGVGALARRARRMEIAASIVLAVAMIAQGWPATKLEPYRKLDWRAIATTLQRRTRSDDLILATNPWSIVCLDFYLRDQRPRRLLLGADESIAKAESLIQEHPRSWIVTAGFYKNSAIEGWACRYPVVLATTLERFRLHYAPDAADFLQFRSGPAETRAIATAQKSIDFGPTSEPFLVTGWNPPGSDGENFERWAHGKVSSLLLFSDRTEQRPIAIRIRPALDGQTATLTVNETRVNVPLAKDWQVDRLTVPMHAGSNLISFEFARANQDELTAQFSRLGFTDEIAPQPLIRLADQYLSWRQPSVAPALWLAAPGREHATPTRGLAPHLLVARLGFDPQTTKEPIPQLAQTLVPQLSCLDDDPFIARAYELLVGRRIDARLARDFRNALKLGMTRSEAVRALLKYR